MQASSNQPPQPNMVQTQYQLATPATESGRLKYANPRDLPSFPSHGLRQDGAAAGAAASLGWANQKSIQPWTPDRSKSASTAAMLAKDYRPPPTWEPNSSSAGAKAALLATASVKKQTPATAPQTPQNTWGSSAANQAFRSSRSARQPHTAAVTKENLGSLSAAKDAMAISRPRSKSSPIVKESYPGESKAAANALSAATIAHRPSVQSKGGPSGDVGAVPYTTLPRSMFTSQPPVAPEVDEQRRADVLHASAVAMAKKMYNHQQRMIDATKDARNSAVTDDVDQTQPRPCVNLQEAAYKLAQERLSKLDEEHQKNREFQEYYYGNTPSTPHRRFTIRGKLRRRSSSDGDINDRVQSDKIREQMSIFSSNLSKVDEQKRARDREALMAAAQRNVKARLEGMDEKVQNDTGKPSHGKLSEWEYKAHAAAQARHDSRTQHKGKLDVGGGMFMDQSEVDAIAAKRVQPVLDEINEKAAVERERLEVQRLEEEARKQEAEKSKIRDKEIKEINRKHRELVKQEEKEKKQQEKEEQKSKREEERALKAEEKRIAKDEKRKSKEPPKPANLPDERAESLGASNDESGTAEGSGAAQQKPTIDTSKELQPGEGPRSPSETGSPTSKMKSWLKSRFSRPRSKSENVDEDGRKQRGFIGGAALRGNGINESSTSLDNRANSMREVAFAGKNRSQADDKGKRRDSRAVSFSTSESDADRFEEAQDSLSSPVSPPAPIRDPVSDKSSSPTRDSRFREII